MKDNLDAPNGSQKCIFQLCGRFDGVRSPALCCFASEFVSSLRKVYDASELENHYVLVIAIIEPDTTELVDRRGVSRFPVLRADSFCALIDGSPFPSDGTPPRVDE